jgi:hypothetical protein
MPLPAVIPMVLGKRAASLFSYDNVMGGDELRNRDYIANAQLRLHANRGFIAHPRRVSRQGFSAVRLGGELVLDNVRKENVPDRL